MSNETQIYAPDYLRAQSDKQLHLIADAMEKLIKDLAEAKDQVRYLYQMTCESPAIENVEHETEQPTARKDRG